MTGVLKIRDFRLLLTGEGVSLVGDQFYFIALPWLVLQLSAGTLALGAVLAVQGVTRAAFMLVGGAVTDRFSPRRVMIGSNVARLAVVATLAALVLGGAARMWGVFVLAAAYGVADGFFFPAQTAIIPRLAVLDQLPAANAFIQGLDQVAQFVGPVLAGVLIAGLAGGALGLAGVGAALALDALTFIVSIVFLTAMRVDARAPDAEGAASGGDPAAGVWGSIKEGFAYMWADPLLRVLLLLVVAVNFLVVGPMLVGVPVLAHDRLSGGAEAYGAIMSAFGGGSLAGLALAGASRRPPARLMGHVLLAVCAAFGAGLAVLGFAQSLTAALVPAALMGFAAGYLTVSFFTWIQARTPQRLMGRMMSLLIFASVGLVPVSQAVSGVVAGWDLTALFVGAALLLSLVVVRAWAVPSLRSMGLEMATAVAGGGGAASGAPAASPAVPDGHEHETYEDERSAEPLRPMEGLVEDEIGREELRRDEGHADAQYVGGHQRPEAHQPGEAELHPEPEDAADHLPEDERAEAVGVCGRREAGGGSHVHGLVHDRERGDEGDGRARGGTRGGAGAADRDEEAVRHLSPPVSGPTGVAIPREPRTARLKLRVAGDPWLYAFARVLLVATVSVYGRFSAIGAGRLPQAGPAIVVANHLSDVDPILLGVTFPRTLRFVADVVQFRRGFVGPVIERLGAIPIRKGQPDRAALDQALDVLAAGGVVAIFAEGDLYRDAVPVSFRAGVGLLAVRSGAPVVPVAIVGAERLWRGGRLHWPWIRVVVGSPRAYAGIAPRRATYDRIAAELRDAVIALQTRGPARRGARSSASRRAA